MSDTLLEDLIIEVATEDKNAKRIRRASAVDDSIAAVAENVPVDDLTNPSNPANGDVSLGVRSLVIKWDAPPKTDYVDYTVVEVRRNSDNVLVFAANVRGVSIVATGLVAGTAYKVLLKHVDLWAHESSQVQVGTTHTPTVTVADQIDLDAATIAGALGWGNLDPLTDPDKLGDDVVVARAMAAHDAAAINLWVQNAAISSAKIASLAADKITTGTLTAQTITIGSGGSIIGGGATIDPNGIQLSDAATTSGTFPSSNQSDWLTSKTLGGTLGPTPYAGIGPFNDGTTDERGWIINADGVNGGSKQGLIVIRATNGNQLTNDATVARIRLKSSSASGTGNVTIKGNTDVDGVLTGGVWQQNIAINGVGWTAVGGQGMQSFRIGNHIQLSGRARAGGSSGGQRVAGSKIGDMNSNHQPFREKIIGIPAEDTSGWRKMVRIRIDTSGGIYLASDNGGGQNSVAEFHEISLDGASFYRFD